MVITILKARIKMKKLGFIAKNDLYDCVQWSGTISSLTKALETEYEIVPIIVKESLARKVIRKAIKIFTHKRIRRLRFMPSEAFKCQRMVKQAAAEGCELFFAPVASELVSNLRMPSNTKLIYLSDATYHAMINYYYFESIHDQNIANSQERRVLEIADEVIYASDWARSDAINYYGITPKKLHVLLFGANLKDQYGVSKKIKDSNDTTIHLLFCGVDWKRKGADIALECVKILNTSDKKRKYDLTIIGLNAPPKSCYENVTFVGRLNKNVETEYSQMIEYYQKSDVFILPTKAECAGIVFSEAAMYALPVFTYITGGTTSYVRDKITGRCLPADSTAEDFSNAIQEMFDQNMYKKYSAQARKYYEDKLNWDTWLSEFQKIVEN